MPVTKIVIQPAAGKPTPTSKLLTTKQAAAYLGIGPTHLWRLEKRPDPPPRTSLGGPVRYHQDDLDAWLARRRQSAPDKAA